MCTASEALGVSFFFIFDRDLGGRSLLGDKLFIWFYVSPARELPHLLNTLVHEMAK